MMGILKIILSKQNKENNSDKYIIVKDGKSIEVEHRNIEISFNITPDTMINDYIQILNSIIGTKDIESLEIK